MEESINYPFKAEYEVKLKTGGKSLKKVKVIGNYTDESNFSLDSNYYVEVELDEMLLPVNIDELKNISADIETLRAFQIWDSRNNY
jgi:hypothetical protein